MPRRKSKVTLERRTEKLLGRLTALEAAAVIFTERRKDSVHVNASARNTLATAAVAFTAALKAARRDGR